METQTVEGVQAQSAPLGPDSGVDPTELMYLLVHTLLHSPIPHMGEVLAKQAAASGLLPARWDYQGLPGSGGFGGGGG